MDQPYNKKKWTKQEDDCLVQAFQLIGNDKWNDIALKLDDIFLLKYSCKSLRTGKQCRQRWYNKLSPDLKNNEEEWKPEHFNTMLDVYKEHGSRWVKIIQKIQELYSIRRSDNGVKNKFHMLVKKGVKELNKFVENYNQQCKKNGLFEQKPKKKYFYPKTYSVERMAKLNKSHQLAYGKLPLIDQTVQKQQQKVHLQNQSVASKNNQFLVRKFQQSIENTAQKTQQQRTSQKIDEVRVQKTYQIQIQASQNNQNGQNLKDPTIDPSNYNTSKYLNPLKPVDIKIVNRLIFQMREDTEDDQHHSHILSDQKNYLPLKITFLQYLKHIQNSSDDQIKKIIEDIMEYTQFARKVAKRSFFMKNKKKKAACSGLNVLKVSKKIYQKIVQEFPDYKKEFTSVKSQMTSRIYELVEKIRQKQSELEEEVKKANFIGKHEEQKIIKTVVKQAKDLHAEKVQNLKTHRRNIWQQKRFQKYQLKKQQFMAKGGTEEEFFRSTSKIRESLLIEDDVPKKKYKQRRIKRIPISIVKPLRKNKQNENERAQQNQENRFLGEQFLQKAQIPSAVSKERITVETPFNLNWITEIPISGFNFFGDINQNIKPPAFNPSFIENLITIPMKTQNQQKVKQEELEEFYIPPQNQKIQDQPLVLKTQNQVQQKNQSNRINFSQNQQIQSSIKKFPSSQLIFKIPLKRSIEEKHVESQNSEYSLKSKKSIRPNKPLNYEEKLKEEYPLLQILRNSTSLKNIEKPKEEGFVSYKRQVQQFLAKSIEIAQQNDLNKSWKFNPRNDSNSPIKSIKSNKSNFNAYISEAKNPFHSQAGNIQFFKHLNNSQQFMGQNSAFNKGSSKNYNIANKPQSIYKSCEYLALSSERRDFPKFDQKNQPKPQKIQQQQLETNSFLQNIRKIEEYDTNQWKQTKVYHFVDNLPQKLQKQSSFTPISQANKGFPGFNIFSSQPLDFQIPQKLIETARNTNFPIRNYNDYSLNYQHVNSMEFSKIFEFDKKFGFNSARLSEIELFKSEDRNQENPSRSRDFQVGSNMFKSQKIQSIHQSCGFLSKSRQLSSSCIYSSYEEKSIFGSRKEENINFKGSFQGNKSQKMFCMKEEQKEEQKTK